MATDPEQNWVATGTSCGFHTVWDIRFLLPINSWQYCDGKLCLELLVALHGHSVFVDYVQSTQGSWEEGGAINSWKEGGALNSWEEGGALNTCEKEGLLTVRGREGPLTYFSSQYHVNVSHGHRVGRSNRWRCIAYIPCPSPQTT